jgi:hypothetical protein
LPDVPNQTETYLKVYTDFYLAASTTGYEVLQSFVVGGVYNK